MVPHTNGTNRRELGHAPPLRDGGAKLARKALLGGRVEGRGAGMWSFIHQRRGEEAA